MTTGLIGFIRQTEAQHFRLESSWHKNIKRLVNRINELAKEMCNQDKVNNG